MSARRLVVVDGFSPQATGLRRHFDERFGRPEQAGEGRFVWDLWHVPGQYTALRTPAWELFPARLYRRFHEQLVWWGRRVLGCHDVSPPWLSCYVNGCEQRLHGDIPHGPFAFVFSLTRWERRRFTGGETLLLKDGALDFWSGGGVGALPGFEEKELLEAVPARFNRLVVFDPRIPHGVRPVSGSMDVREGRLVIHGWFVQPRPFVEGKVEPADLEAAIDEVTQAVTPVLEAEGPASGLISFGFKVAADGRVRGLTMLADTLRGPSRSAVVREAKKALQAALFPAQRPGWVTLPLVFGADVGP